MATDLSSSTENLTLRLLQEMRKEIREIRNEGREVRSLALSLSDQVRRVERRVNELPDTLETMLKSEIMGRLGHFETRMEQRIDEEIERRLREMDDGAEPRL